MAFSGSKLWCAAYLALTGLLVSCGEDDAVDYACGRLQPCGGDVVGAWSFKAACLDGPALSQNMLKILNETLSCATASAENVRESVSGTITFTADSRYESDLKASGALTLKLPSSCSDAQGAALSCEELNAWFAGLHKTVFDAFVCSAASAGCICEISFSSVDASTGDYSVDGTHLTVGSDRARQYEFCAQNNQLHLMTTAAADSSSGSGSVAIQSDMVATK